MTNLKEKMEEVTCKEEGIEPERRIFYALCGYGCSTPSDELRAAFTTKFLALVVASMVRKGQMSEAELDELLYNAVGS